MIIYGSKATEILTENIKENCSHCDTQNSVEMTIFQKYAHVFWIPFFPFSKTGMTQCTHCKQLLEKDEFNDKLINRYKTLKSNTKAPIWTFSGLALLGVLIISGVGYNKINGEKNAELISEPKKGDVYEVKMDNSQYTLFKVDKVAGDSVFVLENMYETNKISGLSDLKDEDFIKESWGIHKTELKNMLEIGTIIDIKRK